MTRSKQEVRVRSSQKRIAGVRWNLKGLGLARVGKESLGQKLQRARRLRGRG
jgi:hypothetical protein